MDPWPTAWCACTRTRPTATSSSTACQIDPTWCTRRAFQAMASNSPVWSARSWGPGDARLGYARRGLFTRRACLAGLDARELLERVGALGHDAWPHADGVRHLGHIDVAAIVDPDAMRRNEV